MIRIKESTGLPVICLKDDKVVGHIFKAVYTQYEKDNICGFLIDRKGYTKKGFLSPRYMYVCLDDILRINGLSCVIYSECSLKKVSRKDEYSYNCSYDKYIGKSILGSSGEKIGSVRDMVFDMETGTIEGFEISAGLLEDIKEGKSIVLLKSIDSGEISIE